MSHIIAVAGRKGGTGKTTLSVNLAAALARRDHTVTLIDADPQGSAASWIPSSERLEVVNVPDARELGRRLAAPRGDLVIVDLPPLDPEPTRVAVQAARLVLVPLGASPLDMRAAVAFLDALGSRVLVVLSRTKAGTLTGGRARELLEARGVSVARTELRDRVAHAEAAALRRPVLDVPGAMNAREEIGCITDEVVERLKLRRT